MCCLPCMRCSVQQRSQRRRAPRAQSAAPGDNGRTALAWQPRLSKLLSHVCPRVLVSLDVFRTEWLLHFSLLRSSSLQLPRSLHRPTLALLRFSALLLPVRVFLDLSLGSLFCTQSGAHTAASSCRSSRQLPLQCPRSDSASSIAMKSQPCVEAWGCPATRPFYFGPTGPPSEASLIRARSGDHALAAPCPRLLRISPTRH